MKLCCNLGCVCGRHPIKKCIPTRANESLKDWLDECCNKHERCRYTAEKDILVDDRNPFLYRQVCSMSHLIHQSLSSQLAECEHMLR